MRPLRLHQIRIRTLPLNFSSKLWKPAGPRPR